MRKRHKHLIMALGMSLALILSACGSDTAETKAQAEGTEASEAETSGGEATEEEQESQAYLLTDTSENDLLQSEIRTYVHQHSGATVVCIDNDDPELAFGVFYHTPAVDETDTNHVFEHAIIASSEKYPSSDLFFDLSNKSYNTFTNAFTYDTFTGYPLSSMNEDQFIKMIDVYLSCMVAPTILEDENIFKREAIRYELRDPDDPIELTGTVYSEDFGFLTGIENESINNVIDALYPGEIAANLIGRAHRNYEALTYEHAVETYERCYSFDNSLILLYGDMDYDRVLGFMDEEYLSKAEAGETDLSSYLSEETEPGYVETVVECPAFSGDTAENASIIDYAVSLDGADFREVLYWSFVTDFLSQESSSFIQTLRDAGINNQVEAGVNHQTMKPYVVFRLYQAEEEQADAFKAAVDTALSRIAEEGLDQELVDSVLRQIEVRNYQIRDTRNAGVNIFPEIVNYWTHSGETDYYGLYEEALEDIEKDTDQKIIRRLAAFALEPERSALVTTVPTPGLAEELIAERDRYLTDMKASMSDAEIAELIADTEAFDAWNAEGRTNNDFVIDPALVEDESLYDDYTVAEQDGMTFYEAPAEVDKVGRYAIYFDSSSLNDQDIFYFNLYTMLLGSLSSEDHDREEVMKLYTEYFSDLSFTPMYPEGPEADKAHPMIKVSWTGLTEDHGEGLELLTELLMTTDVGDPSEVLETVNRHKDSYDLSRYADPFDLSMSTAKQGISKDGDYKLLFEDQDFYYFLEELSRKLSVDESYIEEVAAGITTVRDKLFTRHDLIYVCAASGSETGALREEAGEILSRLPAGSESEPSAQPDQRVKNLAIVVESPDQYLANYGNFYQTEGMEGRYLTFLNAVADRYLIPVIRFQNGAYSAGASFNVFSGGLAQYSYSDPNVGRTLDTFEGTGDAIRGLKLTEEDLNGYILYTLSATQIEHGILSGPMQSVEFEIMGFDKEGAEGMLHDVKMTELSDQDEAAEAIERVFSEGNICAVGNESNLQAEEDRFDEIRSYRNADRKK